MAQVVAFLFHGGLHVEDHVGFDHVFDMYAVD